MSEKSESTRAVAAQRPTHFCNKCGYVGRGSLHRGCRYYAAAIPKPDAGKAAPDDWSSDYWHELLGKPE